MKNQSSWALLLVILCSLSSCVTQRKYDDMLKVKKQVEDENVNLRLTREENKRLVDSLGVSRTNFKNMKEELERVNGEYQGVLKSKNDLLQRYDQLLTQTNNMLATSSTERQGLTEQLSIKQRELDAKQRESESKEARLNDLEKSLAKERAEIDGMKGTLSQTKGDLAAREQKVAELTAMMAAKDAKLQELSGRVKNALQGFSASDLTVREENGRIYVSLSQNLLFKTGSDKIDPKGIEAIKQVAQVLNANQDIEINVEGHTDSDGNADKNWDLSGARALAVTKVLISGGVSPQRIAATGRGLYLPVADNATADGKAKNRRTEIILSPKLDELYKILEK